MSTDAAESIDRLQAGVAAHRAGQLDDAEKHYRAVLAARPENPDALHLLGVVHRQRGRPAAAATLITQALQYAPGLADAHANLGNAYSDMQRFDVAADSYDAARRLGGGNADIQRRLLAALQAAADEHLANGRPAQARGFLERAMAEAPDRLDLVHALLRLCLEDDKLDALALAARAWRLAPDEASFRTLWDLANRAGQDVDRARAFLSAQPDDPFRLIALGNALRCARQGWEAEAVYRAAIARSPDLPFARMRLACLLLEQDRIEAADRLLREAEVGDAGRVRAMQFGSQFFRRLRRRALPPVPNGFAPLSHTDRLVVFAACDGVYFERFASALLSSAHRNAGIACHFHIHVINPPPDAAERVAAYHGMLGDASIALTTERVDASGWSEEARRTWFACARFRLLPHLMEAYGAPVLMLDADLLVLRDLTGLLEAASGSDIAVIATERHKCEPWNWFWADVVFLNATDRALAFADLVARYIDHHLAQGRAHWFLDQIALAACTLGGFREEAAPRVAMLPPDVHRLSLVCRDGVDEPPAPEVLFWSAHASTVDTAMTLDTPSYQEYVLPWVAAASALSSSIVPLTAHESDASTTAFGAMDTNVDLAAD